MPLAQRDTRATDVDTIVASHGNAHRQCFGMQPSALLDITRELS